MLRVLSLYPVIPAVLVALCGISLIVLGLVYPSGRVEHRPTLAEIQQKHEMALAEVMHSGVSGNVSSKDFSDGLGLALNSPVAQGQVILTIPEHLAISVDRPHSCVPPQEMTGGWRARTWAMSGRGFWPESPNLACEVERRVVADVARKKATRLTGVLSLMVVEWLAAKGLVASTAAAPEVLQLLPDLQWQQENGLFALDPEELRVHEFGLSERQLQAQHQAELEAQRLRHETLSHQQQVKIENLEMEVKTLSKKLETKQKQVKDALALTGHVRQNMLARLAFDSGFRMWQARAAESKHNQLQDVLAKKLHDVHMSANFLSAWRQISQTSSREKLLAHERASAGAVRAKLFEQMETERNQLVAQVEDLNKQLGEEAKQRAVLQDNLKRVFMRGVCALNFEAMSLLNDPQGGTATMNAAALAGATEVLAAQTEPPGPPVLPEQQEKAQTEPVAVAALPAEGADSMDDTMQPQVSPTPLPFVSYTGPAARTTGSRGALPKSQRWLASASPARIEKPLAAR